MPKWYDLVKDGKLIESQIRDWKVANRLAKKLGAQRIYSIEFLDYPQLIADNQEKIKTQDDLRRFVDEHYSSDLWDYPLSDVIKKGTKFFNENGCALLPVTLSGETRYWECNLDIYDL